MNLPRQKVSIRKKTPTKDERRLSCPNNKAEAQVARKKKYQEESRI